MSVVVRAGDLRDVVDVARLQVAAWQAAYAGVVPEPVLRRLDVVERVRAWTRLLDQGVVLHVAEDDGAVVGYASAGAGRDEDAAAGDGELYALYVAPDRWRQGTGRRLHDAAVDGMRAEGLRRATLWLLAGNDRGRAFCEALGWRPDGTGRQEQVEDGVLEELRYARALGSSPAGSSAGAGRSASQCCSCR